MELLLEKIHNSEQKWLKPLYEYSKLLFENTHLPSHDAEHHLRVWLHCRGLLIELHNAGIEVTLDTVFKAIIACFFHDSGLTIDVGEQHGLLGRKICEDFFRQNPQLQISDIDEVLEAIEKHDDKSKNDAIISSPDVMKSTLRLVSAADDLDAFGYIGVFRYIEIYIKRGIPEKEIPKKIYVNLRNRFSNFLSTYSGLHRYCDIQKSRYKETYDFFIELDALFSESSTIEDSHRNIYRIIKENIVDNKRGINETIEQVLLTNTKANTLLFFSKLKNELEVTSALFLR